MSTRTASFAYMRDSRLPDLPIHGVAQALALTVLFFSALVDLPRAVQIGPVTSQALLTIGYYLGALLLLILTPVLQSPVPMRTVPLLIFLFWAATSLAWSPAPVNGIQNILSLGILPLMLLATEATASAWPGFAFWLERCLGWSVMLASIIYAAAVLFTGAGTDAAISARSYGMFAAYGVAVQLARWRTGRISGLIWAAAITVLTGVSESRLALGVCVVLFPISQLPSRGFMNWLKVVAVSAVVLGLSYVALNNFDALRDRFLKGDVSMKIGAYEINASGRTAFWRATVDSFQEAPIVGKGAGSAEQLIENQFGTIKHPHNDYLRLIHDYGVIGAAVWAAAILTLLASVFREWRRSDRVRSPDRAIHAAAALVLTAFILEMTMENAIVNIFLTAPLGLLLGAALGIRRARRNTDPIGVMALRRAQPSEVSV